MAAAGAAPGRICDLASATGGWRGSRVDQSRHGQAEEGAERAGHRGPGRPVRGECTLAVHPAGRTLLRPAAAAPKPRWNVRPGPRRAPSPPPSSAGSCCWLVRKGCWTSRISWKATLRLSLSPPLQAPDLRVPLTSRPKCQGPGCLGRLAPVYFFVLHPFNLPRPSPPQREGHAGAKPRNKCGRKGGHRRPRSCWPGKRL